MDHPPLNSGPVAGELAEEIAATGFPLVKGLVRLLLDRMTPQCTFLAVCPNSRAVTRAALMAAAEAGAPLLFAATLNQVDLDGGYTGWTPRAFVDFVAEEAALLGCDTLVLPCLDHGGPWLKDGHARKGYTLEATTEAVKRSLEACIDAGYALLHLDPTVDPTRRPLPVELVVERTLDLLAHAEAYRRHQGLPPISYEVGTEEVHGGLAHLEAFEAFLRGLDQGLRARNLEAAWPAFVVGKVGTDLHTSYFDPVTARQLSEMVRPYGGVIKGHYSDYVDNPDDYTLSGIGGANVGPEFTEEEYLALMDLVSLEQKIGHHSRLDVALAQAVVRSGRWQKWLQPDEEGHPFEALREIRQHWLIRTGSRYVWQEQEVVEARAELYANVRRYRDGESYVLWRIKRAILRYYQLFNLVGFNQALLAHDPGRSTPSPKGTRKHS